MIRNKFGLKNHKKPIYLRQRFSHNSFRPSLQYNFSESFNKEDLTSPKELGKKNKYIFIEKLTNKNLYLHKN